MSAVRTPEKRGTSTRGRRAPRKAEAYESGEVRLAKILVRCIDAQRRGRSVERVLERYPEEGVELRPLLEIAAMLQERHHAGWREPEPAPH